MGADDALVARLQGFIDVASQHTRESWDDHRKAVGRVLWRACVKHKRLLRGKTIALYSGRHQFAADNKRAGHSVDEQAAMLGHASNATAQEHYGRKKFGRRRTGGLRASKQDLSAVQARNQARPSASPRSSVALTPEKPTQ